MGSTHGPEPGTSISTLITSTADPLSSTPTSDAIASALVSAEVSVSVQLRPSHL